MRVAMKRRVTLIEWGVLVWWWQFFDPSFIILQRCFLYGTVNYKLPLLPAISNQFSKDEEHKKIPAILGKFTIVRLKEGLLG